MTLIGNLEQLHENIQTLYQALNSNDEQAIKLVKLGRCFVVSENNGKLLFSPSKFLGYKENNIPQHIKLRNKRDGKETNPQISRLTGIRKELNFSAENAYLAFCDTLNIKPPKCKRTFWVLPDAENLIQFKQVELIKNDPQLTATERTALVMSRIGQGKFRSSLENLWDGCCITNIKTKKALRASHIKPWNQCNNSERLDPNNGLLLVANADAIFDSGLISFDEHGVLLRSQLLTLKEMILLLGIDSFCLKLNRFQSKYMEFHRNNVFK